MKQRLESLDDFIIEAKTEEAVFDLLNEMASPKDIARINDIIKKANGNEAKETALAQQMANSITDKQKSLQRFEAALEILGKDHAVTIIFADRAKALGNRVDLDATPVKEKTHGKLGSEDTTLKAMGRERTSRSLGWRGAPILPIGSVNLASGNCKYFDIYDTWGKGNDMTIEVWNVGMLGGEENAKYRFIFTSGDGPIYKIGTKQGFVHDQTGRDMFGGELVDWANIGDASLIMKKYGKSAPGYVYK